MAEHLLGAQDLRLEYATKVVLDGVTVGVSAGDRVGMVGRNGDGKSTLMRLLLGQQEPDSGLVTRRGGLRVGMLAQCDDLSDDDTVRHAVVGDVPDHEWASDAKIRDIIDGLLADIPREALIGSLSGGQRRRVALAALLTGDWDVIGLDEPTNHLDIEGIRWLADHLKNRWPKGQGAVLVITHDRWFLDALTESTLEVHDAKVEPFEGGYAAYILQRVERDRIAAATESKRQNLLRKELAWLRRGAPARTSKPRFRLDAAAALIANEPPVRDTVELARVATSRIGKRVVDLTDVTAGYGDPNRDDRREILRDVNWKIAPGERAGILGPNGAGKSTLLKLLSGEIDAWEGTVRHGKTLKTAVLDQEFSQLEDIAEDRVREVLGRFKSTLSIDGKDVTPAQMLERLGFPKQYLSARVGELSGGQKRRLQLLLVLLEEPNLLILDEPTNDLDTDMLTALEDLLDFWAGTLIVVSHDRYLLERVTDQQYAVIPDGDGVGRLRHLPGGVDEYLALRKRQQTGRSRSVGGASQGPGTQAGLEASSDPDASASAGPTSAGPTSAGPTNAGLTGAELHAAQKELASLERRMARVEKDIDTLHQEMAVHDQSDFEGLLELTQKANTLTADKNDLEEQWLELSDRVG